jgi:hypothetical protein
VSTLADYARKTYVYLRLGMVTVLLLLAVSVLIEVASAPDHCWQKSISAYYYTPAQAVFVGALVAVGVCLIALKGANELEDILLNIAGMLAPVVAFVPTAHTGGCRSVALDSAGTDKELLDQIAGAAIRNNVGALLVVGVIGMLAVTLTAVRESRTPEQPPWNGWRTRGLVAAWLLLVGGGLWFFVDRSSFDGHAHYAAAITLFVCLIVVVLINSIAFGRADQERKDGFVFWNRYTLVALLMAGVFLAILLWHWTVGWDHWILGIEASLLALFVAFWLIQTLDQQKVGGVRRMPTAAHEDAPA